MKAFSRTIKGLRKFPAVNRVEFMEKKARGRSVLHIGCTGGPITEAADEVWISEIKNTVHYKLTRAAKTITGIDINSERLEKMSKYIDDSEF
ncbi:MAG TPA: hypothetical protein PLL26_05980 [Candidatus Dojkabacteria bacterium]|nr:hypothetical protein [Candidatus Dojkabacteria bacterium]